MPPLVELRRITKRFRGVVANDGVALAVHAGEVHVLLGENGAGKSTVAGLLTGLHAPDAGEILLDGRPTAIAGPRRAVALGIGAVRQHSVLVPTLTVAENLLLGGRWWRRPDRCGVASRLRTTCAGFGIAIDPDALAGGLALGERQLVEIVRAVWAGSRLLVLDEPTSMLGPPGSAALLSVMRRLTAQGVAVVFITHKLDEAVSAGDRVTVLRRGKVAGTIAPADAAGRHRQRDTIMGLMFGAEETPGVRPPPVPQGDVVLSVAGLAGLGFSVHAGEVFGIAGVDGNGQSELAQALAGQGAADAGDVRLGGENLAGLGVAARQRRGLRYVTDDRTGEGSVGRLAIAINLVLKRIGAPPFWRHGMERRATIAAHCRALMPAFDIRAPGPWTPAAALSGGNLQKLLLAREASGARLVIYSKPTYGLDARNVRATQARIAAQAASGVAAILISPDLDELLALCHRIGVMRQGRLVGIVANDAAARGAVGALITAA